MSLRWKKACVTAGCFGVMTLCLLAAVRIGEVRSVERNAAGADVLEQDADGTENGVLGQDADGTENSVLGQDADGTENGVLGQDADQTKKGAFGREPVTANAEGTGGAESHTNGSVDREEDSLSGVREVNIKKVALTFDDGPHPRYTARLLEGLRKRNIHATFFVLGQSAELYPELIQEMAQDGHLIGNHTYSHIQLTAGNGRQFAEELQKTDAVIYEITGQHTEFVRPPYGTWDERYEESLNMIQVLWNVDPLDWCCSDAGVVISRVLEKADGDCIILLHDVYDSSVEAALVIVDELTAQGYEFVTVDEIILD